MKKCIIIGAGDFFGIPDEIVGKSGLVIAADGGFEHCLELGITPDTVIGDFDSLESPPENCSLLRLPVEKDDTDTLAAVKYGLEKGAEVFHIFGGTGGRFDHTVANMQSLVYLSQKIKRDFYTERISLSPPLPTAQLLFPRRLREPYPSFRRETKRKGSLKEDLNIPLPTRR